MSLFRRPPPFFQFANATQLPTAGAMAMGFESEMLAVRPAIGPGIGYRRQWLAFPPSAGVYQATSALWNTGLTGVTHGQVVLQPLSNPYAAGG